MFRLIVLWLAAYSPLALAHVEDAAAGAYLPHWSFEPWVLACLALSLLLYGAGIARLWQKSEHSRTALVKQSALFLVGWLTLAAALVSPLDPLGTQLFSAHMLQHELMMIVAAPLMVMSRPFGIWLWAMPEDWRPAIVARTRHRLITVPWKLLTNSLAAWILHALALWVWHIPALFAAALQDNGIHTLQHCSFLFTALFFWWTVFRDGATRLGCGKALLALFTTMMHTSALGALLTFAATPWYPPYLATSAALGWDSLTDQQLGGLIMWIPGGLVYVGAALTLGAQWLAQGVVPAVAARKSF